MREILHAHFWPACIPHSLLFWTATRVEGTCDEGGRLSHNRSAALGNLEIPGTRTKTYSQRSFRLSGLVAWNSLPPPPPEIRHVVQCFQVSVKDLALQTESSLMFFYVYLYCSSFRYFCLAGAAELIDVSRLFLIFFKAQCGGLPRCCAVEELFLKHLKNIIVLFFLL